ncbi:hypothetical protein GGF43_001465 [Coemansia sp. RSA 2618]|nr:hypothetical protein GGF43_001465 [Coemansia sp. RSA 2618]
MAARQHTQFAYRAQKEMGVWDAPPASAELALDKPASDVRALKYSANGKYLAWAVADEVRVMDAQTQAAVATIARAGVLDVRFSPKGTYVVTWERFSKPAGGEASANLSVWDAATGALRGAFVHKTFGEDALQWTDDERFCAKLVSGEVRFFAPDALGQPALTLRVDGMTSFSVSPGRAPSVAVFVPERGSKPALVRMYTVGSFTRPTANKTFFKAENIEFYWHRLGTSLLVLTQTDVDNTGRSYYGESGLYFMAAAGNFDCRVVLDREGPIHDVAWNPDEKEFVVVYGYMPAKAALFNHRAEPVLDLGTAPRNLARFNPHGRVLALAGLGNLAGAIDLWDRKTKSKICTIDAHGASLCAWAPDGRYLMAATLSPRLRVDNGIRIWHYSGTLVLRQPIDELYHVEWRPAPVAHFPQRASLSPVPPGIEVRSPTPATKPAGAYRPPHARTRPASNTSSPRSLSDMAERKVFGAAYSVPGAAPVGASADMLAKAAEKKRTRNRKKPKDATGSAASASASGAAVPAPVVAPAEPATEVDALKRIRLLKKKLTQINALAARRDAGEVLEANQLSKIESRLQIDSEIADLTSKFSSLSA